MAACSGAGRGVRLDLALASGLLGSPALRLVFEQFDFAQDFDGIRCCASLLHVAAGDMAGVLGRLHRALKPAGVVYASFKHGHGEELREGRLFNDYTEETLKEEMRAAGGWPGAAVVGDI